MRGGECGGDDDDDGVRACGWCAGDDTGRFRSGEWRAMGKKTRLFLSFKGADGVDGSD